MSDTLSLVETVHRKVLTGTLRPDEPLKLWAGPGVGGPCSVCDEPILRSQTEYELQYYDDRPPTRLHVRCHSLWETERHRRYRPRADNRSAQ